MFVVGLCNSTVVIETVESCSFFDGGLHYIFIHRLACAIKR